MSIYVDSQGHKRHGAKTKCKTCGKNFFSRKDQPQKYCSKVCSCKGRRKEVVLKCAGCGVVFTRMPSKLVYSKSGLFFCNRKCKDAAQRIGGIKEIMPDHYGISTIRNPVFYRKRYKELNNTNRISCERCGYSEFECGVDVHHKDGNCKNNTKKNLMALCAPCHRALHFGLWFLAGS